MDDWVRGIRKHISAGFCAKIRDLDGQVNLLHVIILPMISKDIAKESCPTVVQLKDGSAHDRKLCSTQFTSFTLFYTTNVIHIILPESCPTNVINFA